MEQTLGKRIAHHRKRLGLTQDALADRLGITAQAVSKWENDQSCPDITILPKLAGIFGITTDELLGMEPPEPVREAEVVDEEEDATEGLHVKNGNWQFHWDGGRRSGLTFAICILLVGILTLVSKWYGWQASFWDILWPSLLLVYGIAGVFPRFSVFHLAMALFGGYSLVANLGLWHLVIQDDLVFPICVVLFGIGLLIKALRKPKKPSFRITQRGSNSQKTRIHCENQENSFDCSLSFGEADHLVTTERLQSGSVNLSFGELRLDLSQVEELTKDCQMEVNCSFGEVSIKVPRRFRVECSRNTAFGDMTIHGHPDSEPQGVIELIGNVSFGQISVYYI